MVFFSQVDTKTFEIKLPAKFTNCQVEVLAVDEGITRGLLWHELIIRYITSVFLARPAERFFLVSAVRSQREETHIGSIKHTAYAYHISFARNVQRGEAEITVGAMVRRK